MPDEEISFEDALDALEKVVKELEGGELTLEATMEKFEEGMQYFDICTKMLNDVEVKISRLIKDEDEVQLTPVEDPVHLV